MASTVVQSGDYLLELGTGWNWNGFELGDYGTKVTRTNLVTNPSFETNAANWTNAQSVLTRSTSFAYSGTASGSATMSSTTDSNVFALGTAVHSFGSIDSYVVSAYFYVPIGSTLAGRTMTISFEGGTASVTTGTNSPATLVAGSWVRASRPATVTAIGTKAVVCRLSGTLSTAVGQTIYIDGVLEEQTSSLRPYFDGSYAEQWTGYDQIGQTSWTGTANASTSTGQWGLISSATGNGVLDGTTYVLGGTELFADVTPYTTNISYSRGRRKTDYQFGAGTMQFTMLDKTGILGPYDTTSPYYDPDNDQPGLAPMRNVKLSRNGEYLFTGIVTGYNYEFEVAGPNTVNVQCADDFYKLAQTQLDEWNVSAQTSGERVTSVLALPEVAYVGTSNIDVGTVNLGHDSSYTVPQGTNTLSYLQQINTAEQGRLFVARDGTVTFQPRIGNTFSSPIIDFRDDGTAAKYDNLEIEFDADNVVNRTYVAGLNGNDSTANDATSIAEYFTQGVSITNSLLHQQNEIDTLATYLLEPEPSPRYTSLTTWFGLLTSAQRNTVANIDIGDTISIHKQIPGLGSEVASELQVEGIVGSIDVNRGHRITFYTSPTNIVYELILNDITYGILDAENALG